MVEQAGALGYFGDARRAAVGTELLERVTASGSLVIRKLGVTRAGELAIHRFLSAPSVSCREMLATLAGRTRAATAHRHIVVAQDTTEINFAGRGPIAAGLARPATGFRRGFSSIPWSPLTARRRLFSVCSTPRSGPVTTRSRRRHGVSGRLRTRRACAG
jgi:hypothetical protein